METSAYKVYADEFQLDVPMTQSQPIESSQGRNRTPSTPRSSNPQQQQSGESIAPKKPIIIRISKRKQPDLETPIQQRHIDLENLTEAQALSYTIAKREASNANQFADEMMLSQEDADTRIDPICHTKSLDVKKVVKYVSIDEEEEEEIAKVALIRRNKKGSLEIKDTPIATPIRSLRNESLSLNKDEHKELTYFKPTSSSSQSNSIPDLQHQLYLKMRNDEQAQHANFALWIALKYKFKKPTTHVDPCRVDAFRRQYHDDHHDDDALYEGENSEKRQKMSNKDQGTNDDEVPSKEVTPETTEALSFGKVHDYQPGLESYQLKINLTAPKLTFPSIEEKTPYRIVDLPFVGLIYENSKKERRIIDIDEILKFCYAAFRRVLEKVKKINLNVKYDYKDPPLSKEDANLNKFYKEYIQERLKHRDQMRR
nr:hypothetical protein [Tanacetum cinerariifolium]